MAVIGIDLGTTNSLGCVYRNGKAELIPNAYGSYLTPSVVSMMEDGRLVVGQPAKDRLIAEHFLREHGVARQQLRAQEYAVLLKQAERCKKLLSEQDEVVMHATVGDQLYESTYTMDRLFEESKALLKEIRQVIGRALKDGKMTIHDVDLVVMAGGSSKMPLIQKYIRHLFHQAPMVQRNCDELIALGLGLVCGVKERKEEIKDYILTDICPFSLGVATINEADPDRAYMANIINRNTVLPCSRVRRFYTASDQQDYVVVEVHQGENTYAQDNLLLGKIEISVPPKPKGKEAVDVRFTYDINGILVVDTRVVSTGVVKTHIISQKIPEEELEQRVRELEKLKVHPRDLSENQQMLERLEALYQEVYPEQKDQVQQMIRTFEGFLDGQNPRQIQGYRRYLEKAVSVLEYYDPFEEEFDASEDDWDDRIFFKCFSILDNICFDPCFFHRQDLHRKIGKDLPDLPHFILIARGKYQTFHRVSPSLRFGGFGPRN